MIRIQSFLYRHWLVIFCLIVAFVSFNYLLERSEWDNAKKIIAYDISSYYNYLPATFIYNDLDFDFVHSLPEDWGNRLWVKTTTSGERTLKMTSGVAILMAPFFGIAHLYEKLNGLPANGFSASYSLAIMLAGLSYVILGLYLIGKFLSNFLSKPPIVITLILLIFSTNLLIYATIHAAYSHSFSFFLFALFIYATHKYYHQNKAKIKWASLIGLSIGLIVLIRPTNILVALFFIFYGISSFDALIKRLVSLFSSKGLFFIILFAFIAWIPQFLFWKATTGDFIFYSYEDEGFYFLDPKIIKGLFGYRKGWFVYTPIMFFAFLSILYLSFKKEFRGKFSLFFLLYLPLNIYIILSWWSWWYGGSFGHRSFIESYAFMAIPMAYGLEDFFKLKSRLSKFYIVTLIYLCVLLNFLFSYHYSRGVVHYQSMSKEAYWKLFGEIKHPPNMDCMLKHPDANKAKFEGIDVVTQKTCDWIVRPMSLADYKEEGTRQYGLNKVRQIMKGEKLFIDYNAGIHAKSISVSLDENDSYKLLFSYNNELLYRTELSNNDNLTGLKVYEFELPAKLSERRFNNITVLPFDGDGYYFIGHLIVNYDQNNNWVEQFSQKEE